MILLTPVLNVIAQTHPDVSFSYLIFPKIAAEPVIKRKDTAHLWYAQRGIFSLLKAIVFLRRTKFYSTMLSSGVKPWKAWLFTCLLRAERKILEIRSLRYLGIEQQIVFDASLSRTHSNYLMLKSVLELPDWTILIADQRYYGLAPSFPLAEDNHRFAADFLSRNQLKHVTLTIIHPGCMAQNKYRRWKKEYFAQLIELIIARLGHKILIVSGPDELDVAEYLCKQSMLPLLYEKSLANVAAILSQANFFINTDSGIGHLASCFDIPMLTIFGPGDERQTAPFSSQSKIIRKSIACAPCVAKKREPCLVECLHKLTPEEVFSRFCELVNQA